MPILFFLIITFIFLYLELKLIVLVGSALGVLPLILLLLLSAFVGAIILRSRGFIILFNARKQLAAGQIPAQSLFKSAFWIVAGILFLIPGFLTDFIALVLLLPITQGLVGLWLQAKLQRWQQNFFKTHRTFYGDFQHAKREEGDVFDAEFERVIDEDKRLK